MERGEERLPSMFVIPLIQCIAGVVLFMALLSRQRDLVILVVLVLGVMAVAKLWSRMSISRIGCRVTVDRERVFPGEGLVMQLEVENAKFLPVWLRITAAIDDALIVTSGEDACSGESGLLWYERVQFRWDLVARRRGVHRVGMSRVRVSDLFGFFPREKGDSEDCRVIVYPRLVPLSPVTLVKRDLFGHPGARHPVEDPIYIHGVRDYQKGRPARYIHWKTSARHHRLQEKVFESSEQAKVLLVVDVERFVNAKAEKDFEAMLETVASLAVQCDRRGYAVGFATNGVVNGGRSILPVGRNPRHLAALLETLARMQLARSEDLVHTLRHRLTPAGGTSCFHFSREADESLSDAERFYAHRRNPVVFVVCTPDRPAQGGENARRRLISLAEIRYGGTGEL